MRYRLRTLLIVLAVVPPVLGLGFPLLWREYCEWQHEGFWPSPIVSSRQTVVIWDAEVEMDGLNPSDVWSDPSAARDSD